MARMPGPLPLHVIHRRLLSEVVMPVLGVVPFSVQCSNDSGWTMSKNPESGLVDCKQSLRLIIS